MLNFKCFAINLKRSDDRRMSVTENFKDLNLDVEFFEAFEGNSLTIKDLSFITDKNEHTLKLKLGKSVHVDHVLSPSEKGCALSHYFLYKKIVNDNLDYAFIFEDDCIFTRSFKELIDSRSVEQYISKWDIINLSYNCGLRGASFCKQQYLLFADNYIKREGFGNSYLDSLFNRRRFYIGAFAYFITKKGCQRLLDMTDKIKFPADFLIGHIASNHLREFSIHNDIFLKSYDSFVSTIDEDKGRKEDILKIY